MFKDEFNKHVHFTKTINDKVDENQHDIAKIKNELEKLKSLLDNLDFPTMKEFEALKKRVENLENAL